MREAIDMLEPLLAVDSVDSLTDIAPHVPQAWKNFWAWAFTIGIGAFYVLVVVMIPLGLRDLFRLLRRLNAPNE
jgi:hypothetical protein